MATYREIQDYVRKHDGFAPKSCWIAHVMSDHGLTTRQAPNRINVTERKHPCPETKRPAIMTALRHFGMAGTKL
jgi:hypothetical protein